MFISTLYCWYDVFVEQGSPAGSLEEGAQPGKQEGIGLFIVF